MVNIWQTKLAVFLFEFWLKLQSGRALIKTNHVPLWPGGADRTKKNSNARQQLDDAHRFNGVREPIAKNIERKVRWCTTDWYKEGQPKRPTKQSYELNNNLQIFNRKMKY